MDGSVGLYTVGYTSGSLGGANGGGDDGFVMKLSAVSGLLDASFGDGDGIDNDGIVQLNAGNTNSATSSEYIKSIALDGSGSLFVGGYSFSSLGGANASGSDGIIIKMDVINGVLDPSFGDGDGIDNDGIVQFNASNTSSATGTEVINSVILDGSGNIFISGYSDGSFGGVNGGNTDGFILKLETVNGALDGSFGDGDGIDNDGITLLNSVNTNSPLGTDYIFSTALDSNGNIFAGGYTNGELGGVKGGSSGTDGVIIRINALSGQLVGN